jgi:DNA polymerase V
MMSSKGGAGRKQGRNSDWGKKPDSRISVPFELAETRQKKALVRIWSVLEQSGLDFTDLATVLENYGVSVIFEDKSHCAGKQLHRMYSTAVAASFGVISSSDVDAGGYEEVDLNDLLIKAPERTIFLKVTGTSMVDVGIYPNSILVVEICNTTSKSWLSPNTGDIVIALIDGIDFTVKRFEKTDEGVFLVPRNRKKEYKRQQIVESDVVGIVRSVTRLFR